MLIYTTKAENIGPWKACKYLHSVFSKSLVQGNVAYLQSLNYQKTQQFLGFSYVILQKGRSTLTP